MAHTHPFHATLLSATEVEIGPYTNEGVWFESGVKHFKLTSDLVNTPALGRELAAALGGSDAVLLKNHGVAFVGQSVKEATLAGVFLEKAARAQLTLAASVARPLSSRCRRDPPKAPDDLPAASHRQLLAVLQPQARPSGGEHAMKKVAIIGTGTMGPGMAATLARGGMDVACFDTSEAARDKTPAR